MQHAVFLIYGVNYFNGPDCLILRGKAMVVPPNIGQLQRNMTLVVPAVYGCKDSDVIEPFHLMFIPLPSLVPRPLPQKAERGSGVLSDISCHMGRGLRCKKCHIYILHLGLEFSDDLDCCMAWFTKT